MKNAIDLRIVLREKLPALSGKEKQLARYILEHPDQAVGMSIGELAQASGVSASTIVRFCRGLDYSGYKEFSRSLLAKVSLPETDDEFDNIKEGDDAVTVLHNIGISSIRAIQETMQILSADPLEKAVELLLRARRIDLYGMGSSGVVAHDAAMKFARLRKAVVSYQSISDQLLSALTMTPEDVAIIISYTGNTLGILELIRHLKSQGVPVISITRYGQNPTSDLADIALHTCSNETLKRSGAMSSRIAQMVVLDTLYAACCSRDFSTVRRYLKESSNALLWLHGNGTDDRML
ncbi:MAG: MurR/RpiR family transcriptional regulator [Clostridia bacterium]|nr:MurR/RpiR family transcriptional regulator [Clostridia bacterium]